MANHYAIRLSSRPLEGPPYLIYMGSLHTAYQSRMLKFSKAVLEASIFLMTDRLSTRILPRSTILSLPK